MASGKRLVFVSHSGKDTWVAAQIAHKIVGCGATAFLDQAEIEIGENFEEKIIAALNEADELLVLLTPWALDHPYIWSELGVAWGRKLPIVGIVHGMSITELLSQPNIPIYLKSENLREINDLEAYFKQLTAKVKRSRRGGAVKKGARKR
jgi:hypothetical protein